MPFDPTFPSEAILELIVQNDGARDGAADGILRTTTHLRLLEYGPDGPEPMSKDTLRGFLQSLHSIWDMM